jgi:hypothetical protein
LCKRLKMNQRIEDVVIWRHCRKWEMLQVWNNDH